jgi:hypothetical protein
LDRLLVDEICQTRVNDSDPEHELLNVLTSDTVDRVSRTFILERMLASEQRNSTPRDRTDMMVLDDIFSGIDNAPNLPFTHKLYDALKTFLDSLFSLCKSDFARASDLQSMEEGTLQSFSPTASIASESLDTVTVSVSETADCVSDAVADSLDQDRSPALDRFLGDHFSGLPKWKGTLLRRFRPNRLSFFDLVVLAHVVHLKYPNYSRLRWNCMFYATLVFDAAEKHAGNPNNTNNDDEHGRWNNLKVTKIRPEQLSDVIKLWKDALCQLRNRVISCSCSNYSH